MTHSRKSLGLFLVAMLTAAPLAAADSPVQARISNADENALHACFPADAGLAVDSVLRVERRSMESRPPKSVATSQVTPMGEAKVTRIEKDGCVLVALTTGHATRGDWLVAARP
jgi:hypothetical protein